MELLVYETPETLSEDLVECKVTPKNKKIAVIGAGFFGLVSLVALEEEGGFDPVCFEKTDKPGGTWCYREKPEDGVGSTMPSTIINHSKELGALSTFPPKKESNNFMRHHEIYEYIMDYATSRGVLKYIRYKMEVLKVKRYDDYEETGKWTVTVKNRLSGGTSTDVYDGVLVCIGHINRPKMPSYPSQDLFKGEIMHTYSLKEVAPYKEKTVVVVGMGCSGLDAAVEISNVARQVYISTRSGAHVINRVGHRGLPYDTLLFRPYLCQMLDILPYQVPSWLLETAYLDLQFDQKMYTVKPNHWVFSKDPVLNDHFGSKLLSGSIVQKPNIQRFTENGVIFEGDKEVTECDVVIMATGYTWKFSFLEEDILETEEGRINLYKCMFPPHLPHATLAIMGFILTFGPEFPSGELQARWVTQVLAGKCKLPSKVVMFKDIKKRHKNNVSRYGPIDKTTIRVDCIQYCDEIASQFGAKPNLFKMLFIDPKLLLKILFGPSVSYQYRLQGPHSWEGAREAIMTTMDRVVWPMTKKNPEEVYNNFFKRIIQALLLLFLP
ncbi:Dimethylaniline monooxygenase [N-oxide-forming] 2 [Araneus ventricosus]|uniref:Flavin-containing monooxygenase n=1 Tax=Araneus ventricosus TaxID=182803 RepID=A0A4Y2QVL3_ARAVE|nr:Dimethylaniline monooxygenase [N-oxide-forming] 2 [Araneus ventricosus]